MPDNLIEEVPLNFGENAAFGILTRPSQPLENASAARVFVTLNAGLLHRIGPFGLHVNLARELAALGFYSLRVDLSGIGDSPARRGMESQQSVALDFIDMLSTLEAHLGPVSIVLVGLCSGADNAIRLALTDARVVGMVLLDPVCLQDPEFDSRAVKIARRQSMRKWTTPSKYWMWLGRRIGRLVDSSSDENETSDNLALRDIPAWEQTEEAFSQVIGRQGRVLSVYTRYALPFYNEEGQMGRVMKVDGYDQACSEIFWPHVDHTYPLESHRCSLIEEIKAWSTWRAR